VKKLILATVLCTSVLLAFSPHASAQTPTPVPLPASDTTTGVPDSKPDPFIESGAGSRPLSVDLTSVYANNTIADDAAANSNQPVSEPGLSVNPLLEAGRDNANVAPAEPPCAEWGVGPAALSGEESAALAAAEEAKRKAFETELSGWRTSQFSRS